MDISIILPAFNAEQYIDQTIQSVFNQTFKNWELIIIDDGSTDDTYNCILKYQNSNNIRIIRQNNIGVAYSRNIGLNLASGEYVLFVDADDTMEERMLELMYEAAIDGSYDIVISSYNNINLEKKDVFVRRIDPSVFNTEKTGDLVLSLIREQLFNPVWNKLYKRSFIGDLLFRCALPGQDEVFNLECFTKKPFVGYIDLPLYDFYSRSFGSITNSFAPMMLKSKEIRLKTWKLFVEAMPFDNYEKNDVYSFAYVSLSQSSLKNIFRYNTTYNFADRSAYIKKNILQDRTLKDLLSMPANRSSFKTLYLFVNLIDNALMINVIYSIAFQMFNAIKHARNIKK